MWNIDGSDRMIIKTLFIYYTVYIIYYKVTAYVTATEKNIPLGVSGWARLSNHKPQRRDRGGKTVHCALISFIKPSVPFPEDDHRRRTHTESCPSKWNLAQQDPCGELLGI